MCKFGEDVMSNSPKFMVFHLKELIYTFVFIVLGILLIVMLVFMFKDKQEKSDKTANTNTYASGIYTSTVNLNDASMELKLTVDENHINSITIENMDDAIATMYPLVMPAFEDIANQVVSTQSVENINFQDGSMYTYTLLLNSIEDLIDDAKVK